MKPIDKAIKALDADRIIKFPSEREAIEYCKENNVNPSKIFIMGSVYAIREPIKVNTYSFSIIWEDKNNNITTTKGTVRAESKELAEVKLKELPKYKNKNIKLIKVV